MRGKEHLRHVPQTEHRLKLNITDKMIRLSVGVENHQDIISDIKQAFESVVTTKQMSHCHVAQPKV